MGRARLWVPIQTRRRTPSLSHRTRYTYGQRESTPGSGTTPEPRTGMRPPSQSGGTEPSMWTRKAMPPSRSTSSSARSAAGRRIGRPGRAPAAPGTSPHLYLPRMPRGFSPGRDRLFSTRPCSVRDLCIYAGAQRHALPADVIAVDGPESRLSTAAQDGPRCRFERLAFACEDGRAGQVAAECRRGAAAAGDAAHVQQGRGPGLPCCFRQAGVLKARPAETLSWEPGYGWRPWICSPPRRCAAPRRAGCWKAAANYAHEPGSTHQAPWNRSSRLAR